MKRVVIIVKLIRFHNGLGRCLEGRRLPDVAVKPRHASPLNSISHTHTMHVCMYTCIYIYIDYSDEQ